MSDRVTAAFFFFLIAAATAVVFIPSPPREYNIHLPLVNFECTTVAENVAEADEKYREETTMHCRVGEPPTTHEH